MTYKVVDHRHEQIEEERRAALLHLHLHGPASFESAAAADDEGEIVRAQLAVGGGRVGVCEACGGEDGAALYTGLKALLFERKALQLGEIVAMGGALDCIGQCRVERGSREILT